MRFYNDLIHGLWRAATSVSVVVSWIVVHGVAGSDRGFWMACLCFIYMDIYVSAGVPLRKDKQED